MELEDLDRDAPLRLREVFIGTSIISKIKSVVVMAENDSNRFLLISGHITAMKRKEFEQTFRLAFCSISDNCLYRCLSLDVHKEGNYHFFSLWSNDRSLKIFMESPEFQMMNGAFHTLGSVSQSLSGDVGQTQKFHRSLS